MKYVRILYILLTFCFLGCNSSRFIVSGDEAVDIPKELIGSWEHIYYIYPDTSIPAKEYLHFYEDNTYRKVFNDGQYVDGILVEEGNALSFYSKSAGQDYFFTEDKIIDYSEWQILVLSEYVYRAINITERFYSVFNKIPD